MAIPKQPRQLMINIMYLVLTALLALNVSAEIFNAFKVVDNGLINANASLDRANEPLPAIINERSKKKKDFEKYAERTAPARQISKDLSDWIDNEIIDKLIDMGAKIILCDPHRATVIGHDFKSTLKATTMVSPDIRAGVSLLIAALSAKGTSTIHNIEQIDRGYEDIENRLRAIGAKITRV